MRTRYGVRFLPIANVNGMQLGLDARWFALRGWIPMLLVGLTAIVVAPYGTALTGLWTRCLAGASMLVAVMLTSLWHELGHVVASRLAGLSVQAVVLAPQGGVTIHSASKARVLNVFTALGGPLANAVIGGACLLAVLGLDLESGIGQFVIELAALQFLTAMVNLVPWHPMDGGRLVAAYRAR